MPISPNQALLLNRKGKSGYHQASSAEVAELNRITRFHANDTFIVRKNFTDNFWYEEGEVPEDSWEKKNKER